MKVIIFFGLIGLISAQFRVGGWHPFHGTLPQKVVDFAMEPKEDNHFHFDLYV
jgi:hypothetical protein